MSPADRFLRNHRNEHLLFVGRLGFATAVMALMVGALVWRYFDLQISRHGDFVTLAERNRIHVRAIPPPRGLIFDRNGILLADNRPGFTLSIAVERAGNLDALLGALDELLDLGDSEIERFRELAARRRPYESVPLRYNLSELEQSLLAVNEYRLDGVEIAAQLIRHYPLGERFAHVLGYVGRIDERELKTLDPAAYSGIYLIGKTGLERFYERELLGRPGAEYVETNARGRVMRVLDRVPPAAGANLRLHLDARLQEVAYQALAGARGAVVAIDTKTGGVLAMASAPSFDPNPFVTGISTAEYKALIESPDNPLFDRAVRGQYPPGSTVKPVFGLAALDSGIATPSFGIYDPGFFRLDNSTHKYRDWKRGGHGIVNLYDAIVQSCDVYFYTVGTRMGIDRLHRYATAFGFGAPTGVDLPNEAAGIMPSREWKPGARGLAWYPGDTVNTSIGQGFMTATPLQLAVATSRIAMRGEVRAPRLGRTLGLSPVANPPSAAPIRVASEHWDEIFRGMRGVVEDRQGTARSAIAAMGPATYTMAGKTGTAQVVGVKQNARYDPRRLTKTQLDHALFIAFAPVESPRIAVGVLVENGEHGSSTAAPVARRVIDAFMQFYPDGTGHE
ncbi:MAG: penicillin-binding protein 2 [Gammaproteobacteria bacterium]|nr:penicillin-binding protein 2 [Gammaproteobacteria bacterium]